MIIVASSNIFRRELSIFTLAEANYRVREAANLGELLARINQASFALIIVDVQLDGLNVVELHELLRERTAAPLLWIGPAAMVGELGLSERDPLSGFVGWPYTPEELLLNVAQLSRRVSTNPVLD
ncbi:response regulator [Candidatus Gracilibacteria bacterium]|nr:response regulator [Candidatus Gracilibacteria bacterium]